VFIFNPQYIGKGGLPVRLTGLPVPLQWFFNVRL